MIPYMVGKLAPNATHSTRGLVKYVPCRGYVRAVPSQYGDNFFTSPPPPTVERVVCIEDTYSYLDSYIKGGTVIIPRPFNQ